MDRLISILARHFEDRGNFESEDFIHVYGDPLQALLHFRVFWPEFKEVRGHVVLKTSLDNEEGMESLIRLLDQRPNEAREVLAGFRWVEVPYLFSRDCTEDDEDHYLAELMAETWRGALLAHYPKQKWVTRVLEPEETGSVVGVCFEEAE